MKVYLGFFLIENTGLLVLGGFSYPGVRTFSSVEECKAAILEGYDYYIIGGETIYREFLKYCDAVYLTVVEDF